jgi:hypothetical protein
MCHILCVHLSTDVQLDCFYLLAIVNNALMNMGVHSHHLTIAMVSIGNIPQQRRIYWSLSPQLVML